jgi:hypothetical protein
MVTIWSQLAMSINITYSDILEQSVLSAKTRNFTLLSTGKIHFTFTSNSIPFDSVSPNLYSILINVGDDVDTMS